MKKKLITIFSQTSSPSRAQNPRWPPGARYDPPNFFAMGDKSTATRRLNLAQVFNPIGLLIGLLIAQQFVLKNLKSDDISSFENLDIAQKILIKTSDLIVIRDPYVILGLIVLIFFCMIKELNFFEYIQSVC